jgi:4-aminobutyrate aminotransferase-like enzyme
VADEILTGLGRTGAWFACDTAGVVPDLLCVGKALGGGLPLSACIGTPAVMQAWGRSQGEARHTSTFLGNPLACAAALATLAVLRRDSWPQRVARLGAEFGVALGAWSGIGGVAAIRGAGLLWGVELRDAAGAPDPERTFAIVCEALRRGVLLLGDGMHHNVLAFMPPFCLEAGPRAQALDHVRAALEATGRALR